MSTPAAKVEAAVCSVVNPRKRVTNAERPVIAAGTVYGTYCDENGEVGNLADLFSLLRKMPMSLIVCNDSAEFLTQMHEKWSFDPQWQFRITPILRDLYQPKLPKGRGTKLHTMAVNFFGWSDPNKKNTGGRSGKKKNHYHLIIDPCTFSSYKLHDDGEYETLPQLLSWGLSIKEFCVIEGIRLKPTQGGTARQFLQDDRFYPEPRRKVPRATNDKVRGFLPGNFYEERGRHLIYDGLYIDQSKAHHYHSLNCTFPHPDSLYAYGCFHKMESDWRLRARPKRVKSFLDGFHGVIYGRLRYEQRPYRWVPEYLSPERIQHPVGWFTCERDMLWSLGVEIIDIIGAWGSREIDTGLNQFAEWSLKRLGNNPPAWMKTLLLSTYGSLACKPRAVEFGFAKAVKGNPRKFRTNSGEFTATMLSPKTAGEPSTNNVLHRGIIEAATRTESLMFANYLQSKGVHVLCIYADAVIIEKPRGELPLIPDPWRIKTTLTNLRFLSSNAFQADEMTKIPGGDRQATLGYQPTPEYYKGSSRNWQARQYRDSPMRETASVH